MKANNYNGFRGLIENIITEKEMLIPSEEKFEKFASENNLEVKNFEKEVSGIKFNVNGYYINGELLKIEVSRNGASIFTGITSSPQFAGFVSQLKNQIGINL